MRPCAFVLTLGLALCGCNSDPGTGSRPAAANKKLTIAVIPKATSHEFWKSIHAGAAKAGKELGVEVIWKGPLSEADREAQINLVQDFITRRVDGICLAPLDSQSLLDPVREAKGEGIPTVVFDSGLNDLTGVVSYVATDNYAGGALAARRLGGLMGGSGNALLLRYTPGSQSSEQREQGFLETLRKEFPRITVVSDNEYAGASAESALDQSQQLLTRFGDRLDGVFTPCQHVSAGMLHALGERGLAGKVKFVGFDSSPELVRALRDKKLHGIVLQDPVQMAYLAVTTLVTHLRGEKVAARISTKEALATPENLDEPEVRRLLEPEQLD
jgi:ribose transport system substrate-binding protein